MNEQQPMNPAANNRYCWRYTLLVTTLISLTGCVAPCTCTPQMPHAFNVFWSGMTQTGYYWDPRFVGQPDPLCAGFHTTEWCELDAGCGDPLLVGDVATESLREPEPIPLQNETEPAETLPEPAETEPKSGPDFPDADLPITRNHTDTAREPLTLARKSTTRIARPARRHSHQALRQREKTRSARFEAAVELPMAPDDAFEPITIDFDAEPVKKLPASKRGPESPQANQPTEPITLPQTDENRHVRFTAAVDSSITNDEKHPIKSFNPATDPLFARTPGEIANAAARMSGVNGDLDRAPVAALDLPEEVLRVVEPFLPGDSAVDTRREIGDRRQAEQEFGELRRQDTREVGSAVFELRFADSPSP